MHNTGNYGKFGKRWNVKYGKKLKQWTAMKQLMLAKKLKWWSVKCFIASSLLLPSFALDQWNCVSMQWDCRLSTIYFICWEDCKYTGPIITFAKHENRENLILRKFRETRAHFREFRVSRKSSKEFRHYHRSSHLILQRNIFRFPFQY